MSISSKATPQSRLLLVLVLVAAVPLAILVGGAVVYYQQTHQPVRQLRIATGSAGGTYLPLGRGIAAVVNEKLGDRVRAEAVPTHGSVDNMARLERGEVELALVQNDTPGTAGNPHQVRSLAILYDEVLHVLVRADRPAATLRELPGALRKPLAIGGPGSGTERLVRQILQHFALDALPVVSLGTADAVAAFDAGEVDGLCIVSGLRSETALALLSRQRGLAVPAAKLVSLGRAEAGSSLDGIRIDQPFVVRSIIPESVYGREPPAPVGTIGVHAVLVARADLPANVVRPVLGAVFQNKVEVARHHPVAARLSERFDAARLRFPLHEGAEAYYRRDDPSFLVRYAETISLGLTMLVGLGSALLALREWFKRAKKDRIDIYYLEIDELAKRITPDLEVDELALLKTKLVRIRRRAFGELVKERLRADESFTIFQDLLRTEMAEVDRLLKYRRRERGLHDSGSGQYRRPSYDSGVTTPIPL